MNKHFLINQLLSEYVDISVLQKIYNMIITDNLTNDIFDELSNFTGIINIEATYKKYIDTIKTKFPTLQINANKIYIEFEDSITAQCCANFFGDGVGTTIEQLNNSTSLNPRKDGVYFFEQMNNNNALKFNELQYFTNINDNLGEYYMTAEFSTRCLQTVEEITLPPQITKLNGYCFNGWSNLRIINNTQNITYIGGHNDQTTIGYNNDNSLNYKVTFDFSKITGAYSSGSVLSYGITGDAILPSGIWTEPDNFQMFREVNINKIVFPVDFNCKAMSMNNGTNNFVVNQKLIWLSVNPPADYISGWPTLWATGNGGGSRTHYFPDNSVSLYNTVGIGDSSNSRTLSEYANISDDNMRELVNYGCTVTGTTGNWVVKSPNEN